jgi:hypothetical protein
VRGRPPRGSSALTALAAGSDNTTVRPKRTPKAVIVSCRLLSKDDARSHHPCWLLCDEVVEGDDIPEVQARIDLLRDIFGGDVCYLVSESKRKEGRARGSVRCVRATTRR